MMTLSQVRLSTMAAQARCLFSSRTSVLAAALPGLTPFLVGDP